MKKVLSIHRPGEPHWVGDGFPVRTVFSHQDQGAELTPFLLLDHAGPADFEPTAKERGVGWHPHRGFETVTIVYDGEVEHEDTAGNRGRIGPGDVQWMTAGAGVLHKELHGRDFARRGGRFEMLQLWVNLPARSKMTAPKYQAIVDRDDPGGESARGRRLGARDRRQLRRGHRAGTHGHARRPPRSPAARRTPRFPAASTTATPARSTSCAERSASAATPRARASSSSWTAPATTWRSRPRRMRPSSSCTGSRSTSRSSATDPS